MQEIELKLELDAAAEKLVRNHKWTGGFQVGRPITRTLQTIYFDLPDHSLYEQGIALRLRRIGRTWVQTVKIRSEFHIGLSTASEHSCSAPGGRLAIDAIPDRAVRDRIVDLIGTGALAPVFETAISRTTRLIRLPGSVIELAIDVGEIVAGDVTEDIRELEIELIDGDASQLFLVLKQIYTTRPFIVATCSKADRGMALVAGRPRPIITIPRRAQRVPLTSDQSVNTAVSAILLETCEQILVNRSAALAEVSSDVLKQLRIGLRRLRSALLLFRRLRTGALAEHINAEARWLAAEIAKVRDLDVILTDILESEMTKTFDPGYSKLDTELRLRLEESLKKLVPILRSARVQTFLIDLMVFASSHHKDAALRRDIGPVAGKLLDRRWRRVVACAENLEDLTIEQRHDLRKQLKKMRYSIEFLRGVFPEEELKPFLKQLKRLQGVFGDLNDAAMVEEMFMRPDAPLASDLEAQRAIGRVIGARMARAEIAWEAARSLWTDIEDVSAFWKK